VEDKMQPVRFHADKLAEPLHAADGLALEIGVGRVCRLEHGEGDRLDFPHHCSAQVLVQKVRQGRNFRKLRHGLALACPDGPGAPVVHIPALQRSMFCHGTIFADPSPAPARYAYTFSGG